MSQSKPDARLDSGPGGASTAPPGAALVFAALAPFGLGYFLSYLYRAVNAVVAPELVRDVGLTASELGLLTAAYLLAFSLFQLPLGILLDRYGPRRVQATLVAIAALGALLFSLAADTVTLSAARAIIGIGCAGGLMSGFKAVVLWVPEARRALANALIMSVGAIGLLTATTPTQMAVAAFGWRGVFLGLAAITLVVAAIILLVVPERSGPTASVPLGQQIRELGQIYRDRVFLAMAPLLALTAGIHIAVQTLWAGPWFRDIAGLDPVGVANSLLVMAAAFFVGILVSGAVADRLVRRGVSLLSVMLGFLALYLAAQVALVLEWRGADLVVWSVFGMTGQVAILAYPWLSSHFGARLSGRSNAAINLPMFLLAFVAQYAVGAIIDLYPMTAKGGYAPEAYGTAFGILLALQLVALVWYLANWRLIASAQARIKTASRKP